MSMYTDLEIIDMSLVFVSDIDVMSHILNAKEIPIKLINKNKIIISRCKHFQILSLVNPIFRGGGGVQNCIPSNKSLNSLKLVVPTVLCFSFSD